jgi:hypothetical protein
MIQRLAVVLLSGLLGACAESPRPLLRAPDPPPQVLTEECGGLRVQFTLVRKLRSAPAYEVSVTDLSGQPLAEDARVVLAFTSMGKDVSTTTVVVPPTGAGRYGSAGGFTLTSGPWTVEAIVRRATEAEARCVFDVNV